MIRIGLLGASRIAHSAILAPAEQIDEVMVTSVAARDPRRAAEFAEKARIPHVEPDYGALVSSDNVDLVYNALPPSQHASWSIAALRSGKHVLCEKPFALNEAEATAMVAASHETGGILIEAFHYRFHPAFERALEVIETGAIGAPQELTAHFNVPISYRPGELRYSPELGGGAAMDLGCYPVHWVRTIVGAEPTISSATAERHESGVDVTMNATLVFPGDLRAQVSASMSPDLPGGVDAALTVIGESGSLTFDNPLAPHNGHRLTVEHHGTTSVEQIPGETTYYHQLRHVVDVLGEQSSPLTGGEDAIHNMRALDAIRRVFTAGTASSWPE